MTKRVTFIVLTLLFSWLTIYGQITSMDSTLVSIFDEDLNSSKVTSVLIEPKFLNKNGGVQFVWKNKNLLPNDCDIEYELKIFKADRHKKNSNGLLLNDVVLNVKTKDIEFIYDEGLGLLLEGEYYGLVLNAHLLYSNYSEFIDGRKNTVYFRYTPKCISPEKIQIERVGTDFIEVSWSGPEAKPNSVNYIVRYKPMQEGKQWTEIQITDGNSFSIDGLDNKFQYEIGVKKNMPSCKKRARIAQSMGG